VPGRNDSFAVLSLAAVVTATGLTDTSALAEKNVVSGSG